MSKFVARSDDNPLLPIPVNVTTTHKQMTGTPNPELILALNDKRVGGVIVVKGGDRVWYGWTSGVSASAADGATVMYLDVGDSLPLDNITGNIWFSTEGDSYLTIIEVTR